MTHDTAILFHFITSLQSKGSIEQLEQRFWQKVDKRTPTECWEWLGSKGKGYGRFYVNGHVYQATVVSYILHCRVDPNNLFMCHACDNRGCVNPHHLWPGTNQDNMLDAVNKGRYVKHVLPPKPLGELHPNSRLTTQTILDIRTLAASSDMPHSQIAKQFGISREHARDIINRKKWRHI